MLRPPFFNLHILFLLFTSFLYASAQELDLIRSRRVDILMGSMDNYANVPTWLSNLDSSGKWPDINYATGCDAQRANWPAGGHWARLRIMAGAWHGGRPGADQYINNANMRSALSRGMQYWFDRDFTNVDCMDRGGTTACPCGTTGLWNQNWFSSTILIPRSVIQTCLLLRTSLTTSELAKCKSMAARAYGAFQRPISIGTLTGANALDVAQIGVDLAHVTGDMNLLTEAYGYARAELKTFHTAKADGIRGDGAFAQHSGILYNGNYGKDFGNVFLNIESCAAGTSLAVTDAQRTSFELLFGKGNAWMIVVNTITGVFHWDFSALSRFLVLPVADMQATGDIRTNITQVAELGRLWSSQILKDFATRLTGTFTTANAGNLLGNRMFYTSDYMVHREAKYVTSVKMYSSRTVNSECINGQNPRGFHLSDGAVYNYIKGDEYEDIQAAWNWNLIPGTTVDYEATALSCDKVTYTGVESFVGGVSTGTIGATAMRFTNPISKTFKYQKAWFFFEGVQFVMVAKITRTSGSAPIYSVLDQRRRRGRVMLDNVELAYPTTETNVKRTSLWHGDVGYVFNTLGLKQGLTLSTGKKTGAWSAVGTSTRPPTEVDFFTAYIQHTNISHPLSYTVFPGVTYDEFLDRRANLVLQNIKNDNSVSAVYHPTHKIAMFIFWDAAGGTATWTPTGSTTSYTVTSNANSAVIYRLDAKELTVSDPSQLRTLTSVTITVKQGSTTRTVPIALPTGGSLGRSATATFT